MLDYLVDHPESVGTDMELPLWASQVVMLFTSMLTCSGPLFQIQPFFFIPASHFSIDMDPDSTVQSFKA
jgi:hypothetical protein